MSVRYESSQKHVSSYLANQKTGFMLHLPLSIIDINPSQLHWGSSTWKSVEIDIEADYNAIHRALWKQGIDGAMVDLPMTDTYVLNVNVGELAISYPVYIQSVSNSFESYVSFTLVTYGEEILGTHNHNLYIVRFDVGDGTYLEKHVIGKENANTSIERWYNTQKVWSWS